MTLPTCDIAVTWSLSHVQVDVSNVVGSDTTHQYWIAFYWGGVSQLNFDFYNEHYLVTGDLSDPTTVVLSVGHTFAAGYASEHDFTEGINIAVRVQDPDLGNSDSSYGPAKTALLPLPQPAGTVSPTSGFVASTPVTMTVTNDGATAFTGPPTQYEWVWNDPNYFLPGLTTTVPSDTYTYTAASTAMTPYVRITYQSGYSNIFNNVPGVAVNIVDSRPNLSGNLDSSSCSFDP